MSNEEQFISEFERLLESVIPADPSGNPMQTMYLAGQQSADQSSKANPANRIWKLSTFVSSSVAAGLMIMLISQQAGDRTSPSDIASVNTESTVQDAPNSKMSGSDIRERTEKSLAEIRGQNRANYFRDPLMIAKATQVQRSIDMFEDFEIKPTQMKDAKMMRFRP